MDAVMEANVSLIRSDAEIIRFHALNDHHVGAPVPSAREHLPE
jgi:hypothetical protein